MVLNKSIIYSIDTKIQSKNELNSRLKMSPWVLISSCSTDRLLRCNLSSDTSLVGEWNIILFSLCGPGPREDILILDLLGSEGGHHLPGDVAGRQLCEVEVHHGGGARLQELVILMLHPHRVTSSHSMYVFVCIFDNLCGYLKTVRFYLSCNIFCLNLKWSSRDFSFSFSILFFFFWRFICEETSFFLTEDFDS